MTKLWEGNEWWGETGGLGRILPPMLLSWSLAQHLREVPDVDGMWWTALQALFALTCWVIFSTSIVVLQITQILFWLLKGDSDYHTYKLSFCWFKESDTLMLLLQLEALVFIRQVFGWSIIKNKKINNLLKINSSLLLNTIYVDSPFIPFFLSPRIFLWELLVTMVDSDADFIATKQIGSVIDLCWK